MGKKQCDSYGVFHIVLQLFAVVLSGELLPPKGLVKDRIPKVLKMLNASLMRSALTLNQELKIQRDSLKDLESEKIQLENQLKVLTMDHSLLHLLLKT